MPTSVLPAGWPRPRGYSNGVIASGRVLAVAGQIGWDASERIVSSEFAAQFAQALANVVDVVSAAGGEPSDVVSLTIFVTDLDEYRASIDAVGTHYRAIMGRCFPAMALIGVAGLLEPGAKVEIQALAVLAADKPPGT